MLSVAQCITLDYHTPNHFVISGTAKHNSHTTQKTWSNTQDSHRGKMKNAIWLPDIGMPLEGICVYVHICNFFLALKREHGHWVAAVVFQTSPC